MTKEFTMEISLQDIYEELVKQDIRITQIEQYLARFREPKIPIGDYEDPGAEELTSTPIYISQKEYEKLFEQMPPINPCKEKDKEGNEI